MFKPGTVFIVGAGASAELGMPVGQGLKDKIASLAMSVANGVSTDENYLSTIKCYESLTKNGNANEAREVFSEILMALPFVSSIDNLAEIKKTNNALKFAVNTLIAQAMLNAEANSKLSTAAGGNAFDLNPNALDKSWLQIFCQILFEGCDREKVPEALGRVEIVTFNYDRSIEIAVMGALRAIYNMSFGVAKEMLKTLSVNHLYGDLGDLPTSGRLDWNSLGLATEEKLNQLDVAAQSIITFSEATKPDKISRLQLSLANGDNFVVLGCAMHEQNLKLLESAKARPSRPRSSRLPLYITVKGQSESDSKMIGNRMSGLLCNFSDSMSLSGEVRMITPVPRDAGAFELMQQFRRTLSSPIGE